MGTTGSFDLVSARLYRDDKGGGGGLVFRVFLCAIITKIYITSIPSKILKVFIKFSFLVYRSVRLRPVFTVSCPDTWAWPGLKHAIPSSSALLHCCSKPAASSRRWRSLRAASRGGPRRRRLHARGRAEEVLRAPAAGLLQQQRSRVEEEKGMVRFSAGRVHILGQLTVKTGWRVDT